MTATGTVVSRSSDDLAQKNETTEKTFPISLVTYEPGQNRNSGMLNQIPKKELFNLRFQNATNQLDNTSRIKEVRKNIARIQTVITEQANAAK